MTDTDRLRTIRERLRAYLDGLESANDFFGWFLLDIFGDNDDKPNPELRELTGDILLLWCEWTSDHWTDEEFHAHLRDLVA